MDITTLIPAYKSKYLISLLQSIRNQILKPKKIYISDDSPNRDFINMINNEPLKSIISDFNITTLQGPRLGAYNNIRFLMHIYNNETEYFHILNDDDCIYPNFYEYHIDIHKKTNAKAVVSRRWTSDEFGVPLRDLPVPLTINSSPDRVLMIDSYNLFQNTAALSMNWLGEFSNATYKASMSEELDNPSINGVCYSGLEDLGSFLRSSLHSPIAYINEHLGYFRLSNDHHSAQTMGFPMKWAFLAYFGLAISGNRIGKLTNDQCRTVLNNIYPIFIHHFGLEADLTDISNALSKLINNSEEAKNEFLTLWHDYCQWTNRPTIEELISSSNKFLNL